MPDAHDELCEKADVGSLCDCHCAGAKHAIRHTKGGVPGAGAVSKAAQKAAHEAGRAPVVNNKAQPKEGSRIAPGAPKTFKEAAAGGGKGGKAAVPGGDGPGKQLMTVSSRTRNGDAVTEKAAAPQVRNPAALRDALAVIADPAAFEDTSAAARYQKLTPEHLAAMSPQQKQAMLDDMRQRVKTGGYKKNSPTGQKLERGYNALVHAGSDVKAGMQAGNNFQVRAGDKVTHPQFGHGKVVSSKLGGDFKTTGAEVDFGDRKQTVPHSELTFGHTPGGDKNPQEKAAAGAGRDAARQQAAGKKLVDFADRVAAYDKAVAGNDLPAKARLGTTIGSSRKDYSSLGEFNEISKISPEVFKALPAADQVKVVAAVKRVGGPNAAVEVQHRVNDTLHAWTGQGVDVHAGPDPEHVVQAKRALAGQPTTLPTSMALARVDDASLKTRFTPQERAVMRHRAQAILAGMRDNAPDRAGLQKFVEKVDALDGADSTTGGLKARAKDAERRSTDPRLSFEKRQQARAEMHDLEKQAFNAENPHRTPGPGAETFQGKKVKPVTATQQPVLEAVAAGSGYRSLPTAAVNQLERTGHIKTILSNDAAHLTELGHVKVAAQRGDAHHQQLNEKVAQRLAEYDQADKASQQHAARRNDPLQRDWSRRSQEIQNDQQQAYGRWQLAIADRNAHVAGGRTGGAAPDSVNGRAPVRDNTERVISRDGRGAPVQDTARRRRS